MKNQELFNRTIGILVKAYQSGTLQHSECRMCAVGNLVAANMGYEFKFRGGMKRWFSGARAINDIEPSWVNIHIWGKIHEGYSDKAGLKEIASTGYTPEQTCKIELAFENVQRPDEDGYLGLMSVVDTLMLIHEANETEVKQAKDLFVLA